MKHRGGDPISQLTPKQRVWLEAYLTTWNASEASRIAGYTSPSKVAWQMTQKPLIKAAIEQRMRDARISADEVIVRLMQQATANVGDFFTITPDGPEWNWEKIKEKGFLVKSVTKTRDGYKLEFYDAQKALELLGRSMALFTDNVKVDATANVKGYVSVSPDDWDDDAPGE